MILSSSVCVVAHAQSTQNKKYAYLRNISRKTWEMKLIFCLHINTNVFYKLIASLGLVYSGMPKVAKITSLQYKMQNNNLKENMKDKVDFCLQINIKCFLELILSFLVCVDRHTQITQNNKFVIFL